jgi:ADP-ribose pyrophosphatase YjhB (NUDIX family)
MAPESQLATIAVMVREDGKVLLVRHPIGPFAGKWSMPLIGVADHETAEVALERMFRDMMHIEPGPFEFLDTLYLAGSGGERFIGNAFTCVDWTGDLRFSREVFDDAIWVRANAPGGIDLLPEVREFLATAFTEDSGVVAAVQYDALSLTAELAGAREQLIAAFDAFPVEMRAEVLDEGGWSPLDAIAHAADAEAYYIAELRRCMDEPGRVWISFNGGQWGDMHRLRPVEDEAAVRERLVQVRSETESWLRWTGPDVLQAWVNHPERGVVQAGSRVAKVAAHDREHTEQIRRMWQTATIRTALDPN